MKLVQMVRANKAKAVWLFIIHELDAHFGMGINSVPDDYKEKFINKHKEFSAQLIAWYNSNYEINSEL